MFVTVSLVEPLPKCPIFNDSGTQIKLNLVIDMEYAGFEGRYGLQLIRIHLPTKETCTRKNSTGSNCTFSVATLHHLM